ncbi:MAG: hypothetical protein LAQ30_29900 [Acidobacteriia bacterium]|nr:hypothetical protein [Terriglobia bacterium]
MISLRLSEAEYEVLKAQYRNWGTRNVSEFARLALQRIVTAPPGSPDMLAARLSELDDRLHKLESHVSLLLEREKELA